MNRLIFTCMLLLSSRFAQSQVPVYDTLNAKTSTAGKIVGDVLDYTDTLLDRYYKIQSGFSNGAGGLKAMPDNYFNDFIGRYFSYVVAGRSGLPDGNSVTLTPTTNSTRLNGNLSKRTYKTIYNAGFSADFSNNIANVISGKDVTSNTTFYTNISFLQRKRAVISFDANDAQNANEKKILKIREFKNNFAYKYRVTYDTDLAAYNALKTQLNDVLSQPTWVRQVDSVAARILKLKNDLGAALVKVKSYGLNENDGMYTARFFDTVLTRQFEDSLKTIIDTLELNNSAWQRFHFTWLSGGLTYTRQGLKTYDNALSFNDRIADLTFNNVGLIIGFNYLSQKNPVTAKEQSGPASFYFTGSYTIANDLNYTHLNEMDVDKYYQVVNNDTVYRFDKNQKVRDISGKNKQTDWLHTAALQTIIVLSKTNFIGISAGLTGTFGKFTTPVYNGRLGLLFRFVNSDDQKSKLNFEIFLQLNDWRDVGGSGHSTWQRKVVGFNVAVPFNKLFF